MYVPTKKNPRHARFRIDTVVMSFQVFWDILTDSALIFGVKQCDREDEGTTNFRNVCYYLPVHKE